MDDTIVGLQRDGGKSPEFYDDEWSSLSDSEGEGSSAGKDSRLGKKSAIDKLLTSPTKARILDGDAWAGNFGGL